jgi:hypothetical protein
VAWNWTQMIEGSSLPEFDRPSETKLVELARPRRASYSCVWLGEDAAARKFAALL